MTDFRRQLLLFPGLLGTKGSRGYLPHARTPTRLPLPPIPGPPHQGYRAGLLSGLQLPYLPTKGAGRGSAVCGWYLLCNRLGHIRRVHRRPTRFRDSPRSWRASRLFLASSSMLRRSERSPGGGGSDVARSPWTQFCPCKFRTNWKRSGPTVVLWGILNAYPSVIARKLFSSRGRVNTPFANGLNGMHPTPRC